MKIKQKGKEFEIAQYAELMKCPSCGEKYNISDTSEMSDDYSVVSCPYCGFRFGLQFSPELAYINFTDNTDSIPMTHAIYPKQIDVSEIDRLIEKWEEKKKIMRVIFSQSESEHKKFIIGPQIEIIAQALADLKQLKDGAK